jgi:Lrp/AsnC family transcriptional regulator, regulator of ectoine-degradation genes
MKLDRYDLQIIEALQKDGRLPAARLAEQVGLTASPTWERVRKLEESGVIRGYHADVAAERLGGTTSIVIVPVTLENHRANDFRRFEQAIEKIPQVVEILAVGGGVDYVVRFVVKSIDEYQQIIEQLLRAELGIQRYWSYIVTKPIKAMQGVPVRALVETSGT